MIFRSPDLSLKFSTNISTWYIVREILSRSNHVPGEER